MTPLRPPAPLRPSRAPILLGVTLASSLLLAACGPQASPKAATAPSAPAAIPVSAEAVRRGDLQQTLAYSGDLRARSQVAVLSKATGRVEQLLVDVGSRVKAGDVLAELEQDNPALQALQATASLAAAEAKLAQVMAGGRAEDVAAARAALAGQQVRLANMQSGGRAEDVAAAEAALDAQQARLEQLELGARPEAIAQAQANVDAAQARLALLRKGAPDDVRQARQSAVESARASLAAAEATAASLEHELTASLTATQGAYDAAVAARLAARAAVDQTYAPTSAQILAAELSVKQAQASLESARSASTTLDKNARSSACADGSNEEVCNSARAAASAAIVAAEKSVALAEESLALLKKGGDPATRVQRAANLTSAEAQVRSAQGNLDALRNGGLAKSRAQVAAQVVQARESLKSAEAALKQTVAGPQPEEVRQAELAVLQAEEALKMQSAPTEQDLRAQRAAEQQARLALEKARRPYTEFDLQQQRHAVAQAQAILDKARSPFAEQDLQAAEAQVEQARASLALAELGVRETTVVSPVDGIVSERLVSHGALVSPSAPLFQLVPPALELVVNVEEAKLGQIAEGQPVSLEVAAYPGVTFAGRVRSIAPTVDTKSRTASVRIEPLDEQGKLRAGMLARLKIVTAQKPGALLLPREAVPGAQANSQTSMVTIGEGNRARKVVVGIGLVTDTFVEVLGGLEEGQLVATTGAAMLSDGDLVAQIR